MSVQKACPFCGKPGGTGHHEWCYFRVRGKSDEERENAWQSRPIEDDFSMVVDSSGDSWAVFGLLAEALCVMASENDERGGK